MKDQEMMQLLDGLEKEIRHEEAIAAIQNRIRKYAAWFHTGNVDGILSCFARTEAPELIFGSSKVSGREAISQFYGNRPMLVRLPGTIVSHEITTEVIVIASDEKTARVTANASGYKGLAPTGSQVNLLGKYSFEMIREDGEWKIWRLQWIMIADADFNYGWLFQNRSYYLEDEYPALSEEPRPGMLTEAADSYMDYFKPDEVQVLLPEPPDEYQTWDGYRAAKNTRGY